MRIPLTTVLQGPRDREQDAHNRALMDENKQIQRTSSRAIEKGQYVLAFVVIASMLLVANFPMFVILFFAIFAYFLWKIFATASRSETRDIFEFYLAANDILRDDERRWFGFEVHDVILRGERIVHSMRTPPPLVNFTLGALYNKVGEHTAAEKLLASALEAESGNEMSMVSPSEDLRNYVRILRKIEREPAEAPLTSAAIRALERARKNRGRALLDESRSEVLRVAADNADKAAAAVAANADKKLPDATPERQAGDHTNQYIPEGNERRRASFRDADQSPEANGNDQYSNRKPISEVLHDIYDGNVQ